MSRLTTRRVLPVPDPWAVALQAIFGVMPRARRGLVLVVVIAAVCEQPARTMTQATAPPAKAGDHPTPGRTLPPTSPIAKPWDNRTALYTATAPTTAVLFGIASARRG